ncbi:phage major capsid protein [Clostridium perfringens]|uniref:phage major capsid protein n=1 Tax=Clostridium perfringens TaxID=1502 RepID=UPI0018E407CE|nr:phage major capsid protein [Clostridium perfringens]MBI6092102.1 phage major capsid protein [Clostridium perfringens]
MKFLYETRAKKLEEVEALINNAEAEERVLTEEELEKVEALKKEVEDLKAQIELINATKELKPVEKEIKEEEVKEDMQNRALELQTRAREEEELFVRCLKEGNIRGLKASTNGGFIPQTVAEKIVEMVSNNCPVLEKATLYKVVGDLKVNVQNGKMTTKFVDELNNNVPTDATLKTVTLKSHTVISAIQISNLLISESTVNVIDEVARLIANDLTDFLNDVFVIGETGKVQGLAETTNIFNGTLTLDSIVSLMTKVPVSKHKDAVFIMSPEAFAGIKTDAITKGVLAYNGMAGDEGMFLFGKPVYLVDALSGKDSETIDTEVIFANLEGYAIKMPTQMEIKVLKELYAMQDATGIVATCHVDGKIVNEKLIAKLTRSDVLLTASTKKSK